MDAKTLRTAAALLVALGLLAAVAPAAAAPEGGPIRADAGIGPDLLHPLTAWLAGLWPGAAPGAADGPTGLPQGLGAHADPNGEPPTGSTSGDDPAANPELGPRADPDG